MKLYLIRHGESEANVNPEVYLSVKDHNIELTEKGKSQSLSAGEVLNQHLGNKSLVLVSPYQRTRETWSRVLSKLLKKRILKIKENALLREQEYKIFADIEDMTTIKAKRMEFGAFFYRFKNAESVADVNLRVQTVLNELMIRSNQGEFENVVVVTHEVVIRVFLMILNNLPHEKSKVDIGNGEVLEVTLNKQWEVESLKNLSRS